MITKAILAATAAAFLLASGPGFAAETQHAQTQAKNCYRTVPKLPYRLKVRCPQDKVQTPSEPVKPQPPKTSSLLSTEQSAQL